jgi:hypothetical protein
LRHFLHQYHQQLDSEDNSGKMEEIRSHKENVKELEHHLKQLKLEQRQCAKYLLHQHESSIQTEERCRNMKQIIRYRRQENDTDYDYVDESTLT